METLQQRLIKLRNNEKQEEIARLLNIKQQQYSRYETGKSKIPLKSLIILAKHYTVSTDYLLGLSDQKAPKKAFAAKIARDVSAGDMIDRIQALTSGSRIAMLVQLELLELRDKADRAT